jgi:DNA-binding NtrC family response regulator
MDQQARREIPPEAVPALRNGRLAEAFHVCLAGSSVTNNRVLIESLKRDHQVTVIESLDLLLRNSILSTVDVLLLDGEEGGQVGIETLRALLHSRRGLCVVLVNGGLTQNEIAAAFREGVRDYFSHHFNVPLLVERVGYLCSQSRRQQPQY